MNPILPEQEIDPAAKEQIGRLGNGAVLLARDNLQDPNFIATVVLICIYTADGGTYGLVLNRPSHMPLSEIFDGFGDMGGRREVYIGGPVRQEELQIIQITDQARPESHQVAPRVFLGGKWESIGRMLALDPDSTLVFLGYSGWSAGQLETEIEAGAWDVYRVDIETLVTNIAKIVSADVKRITAYLDSIKS